MVLCHNCKKVMVTSNMVQVGVPVLFLRADGGPYKLQWGDLRVCPGCGAVVIDGQSFGNPTWHYENGFEDQLEGAKKHPFFMEVK